MDVALRAPLGEGCRKLASEGPAEASERIDLHRRERLAPIAERKQQQTLELVQVHELVVLLEDVGETALGQPPVQRHLTALESDPQAGSRACPLTLVSTTGRASLSGCLSPANAFAVFRRAFRFFQCAEIHMIIPRTLVDFLN